MTRISITGLEYTPAGKREFDKLPQDVQKRILKKMRIYIDSGRAMSFAGPLVNIPPSTHRFRIGKYRVCFYLVGGDIVIDGVDTREDAYRKR